MLLFRLFLLGIKELIVYSLLAVGTISHAGNGKQ